MSFDGYSRIDTLEAQIAALNIRAMRQVPGAAGRPSRPMLPQTSFYAVERYYDHEEMADHERIPGPKDNSGHGENPGD
ncbi:hypothetical protein MMC22_008066 [Lobaria immixta]|nr:hypothetical protein [Lobaria immixta]